MQRCDLSIRGTTFDLLSQSMRTERKFQSRKSDLCMTRIFRLVSSRAPHRMSKAPTADHQSVCDQLPFLSKPCQNFRSFSHRGFHRSQIFLVELFSYFYSFFSCCVCRPYGGDPLYGSWVCVHHFPDIRKMVFFFLFYPLQSVYSSSKTSEGTSHPFLSATHLPPFALIASFFWKVSPKRNSPSTSFSVFTTIILLVISLM